MNQFEIPWAKEYESIGFKENWLDPIISRHGEDVINDLSELIKPEQYYGIRVPDIEKYNYQIPKDILDDYSRTNCILVILDTLDEFSRQLPETDSEIFDLYTEIQDETDLETTDSFPDFYRFCRDLQHNEIKVTKEYRMISKTHNKFNSQRKIREGSIWILEYKNKELKVKVKGKVPTVGHRTVDRKIYCEILEGNTKRDDIQIPKGYFDSAEAIKKVLF